MPVSGSTIPASLSCDRHQQCCDVYYPYAGLLKICQVAILSWFGQLDVVASLTWWPAWRGDHLYTSSHCSFICHPLVHMLGKQLSSFGEHVGSSSNALHTNAEPSRSTTHLGLQLHRFKVSNDDEDSSIAHQKHTEDKPVWKRARLALLLAHFLVVAVTNDLGQCSWPAMWIATLDCNGTSDETLHKCMQTRTVAAVTHKSV